MFFLFLNKYNEQKISWIVNYFKQNIEDSKWIDRNSNKFSNKLLFKLPDQMKYLKHIAS